MDTPDNTNLHQINISVSGSPFTTELGAVPPCFKYPSEYPIPSSLWNEVFAVDKLVMMEYQQKLMRELEERLWIVDRFLTDRSWDYWPVSCHLRYMFKNHS